MTSQSGLNFWDHLDELRHILLRIVSAVCVCMFIAFCFKEPLFRIVLAPKSPDFVLYRLLELRLVVRIMQQYYMHVPQFQTLCPLTRLSSSMLQI